MTIVIPTYNEADNLKPLVSALFSLPLDLRAIIVDDNSPDGTGGIANDLALTERRLRVIHRETKLGLRSAYMQGMQCALDDGAEAVGQMDADFSHDPARIPEMVRQLESCDMVLGSRYVRGGSLDRKWPVWRKALSGFANFYTRSILAMPQRDITTGYRIWRRQTLEGMPLDRIKSSGYVCMVELTYLAYCLEYCIEELPIYFAERRSGRSKMSFRIQAEAAVRVGFVRWSYRDLRRAGKRARLPVASKS